MAIISYLNKLRWGIKTFSGGICVNAQYPVAIEKLESVKSL